MGSYFLFKQNYFKYIFYLILAILGFDIFAYLFIENSIILKLAGVVREKNIPTLFSTFQLILSGNLLYIIYKFSKKKPDPKPITNYWKILSFLFYFLAFDEWFTVHDIVGKLFSNNLGAAGDLFGWTLIYLILIPIFLLFSIRFLLSLPKNIAIGFIVSGAVFVFGAIGLELLNKGEFQLLLNLQVSETWQYIITLFEESFEILGIFLFNFIIFYYGFNNFGISDYKLSKRWYVGLFLFGLIDIILTIFVQLSV